MYSIINLNLQSENIFDDELDNTTFNKINNKDVFCCSINTIQTLSGYNDYPIKNKSIAIRNVLDFLRWIESTKQTILPIKKEIWITYFTSIHYKKYMTILQELNILSFVKYGDGVGYIKGERYNLYRLFNNYIYTEDLCLVMFSSNTIRTIQTDKKYNKKLTETIRLTTINYKAAIQAEINYHRTKGTTINSLRSRLSALFALNSDRYIMTGDKSGRITHSFSSISRVSRKFLTHKDQEFTGLDIVNAQPSFLCYFLTENKLGIDTNYIEDCESGMFYQRFYHVKGEYTRQTKEQGNWITKNISLDFNEDDADVRGKVKVELYQSIFFFFAPKSPVAAKFKELYPLTYASIEAINTACKEDSESTLAALLQQAESSIMNNITPIKSQAYFPLYDALYMTSAEDVFVVKKQIEDKFSELGLRVKIEIE